MSDGRTSAASDDEWTLETAREALQVMLVRSVERGVLDEGDVSLLTMEFGQAVDLFTLHTQADQVESLGGKSGGQLCRYPTCFHPRRAAGATGAPPVYCDVVKDGRGQPAHDPIRSLRTRKKLTSGDAGALVEIEPERPGPAAPVSDARLSLPARAARVEQVVTDAVATITSSLDGLRAQVATIGNDEAAEAEILGIRNEADKRVQEADGKALEAQRRERQANAAAADSARTLEEAITAAEDAEARATAIQETADQAHELAEQARQRLVDDHAEELQAVRDEAERAINEARDQAEKRIAAIIVETDGKVANAQADAADARTEADNAAEELEQVRITAAEDRAAANTAREDLARVRGDLDKLQTRLDTAEARFAEELAHARRETTAERERASDLQTRLDDVVTRHRTEISDLKTQHQRDRDAERTAATAELQRVLDDATRDRQAAETARTELENVRTELRARHQAELEALQHQHQQDREADRTQWASQQEVLVKAHTEQVATLREALTSLTRADTDTATEAEKKGTTR